MDVEPAAQAATVAQALAGAALPPREARALLAQVLGATRESLVAHPQRALEAAQAQAYAALVRRRHAGEPMAYLLGVQEFYGHRLKVTPDVLVPRPETELLVEAALALAPASGAALRVLDLGTGSGAVAIALALARPAWQVVATDCSAAALRVAEDNAVRLGARLQLHEGLWYAAVSGCFDLIVTNPPYIAAADPHLAALGHEPRAALTDEADGLTHLQAIVAGGREHLRSGGVLLVEHGYDQAAAVRALLNAAGYARVGTLRDGEDRERVTGGESPQG